MRVALVTCRSLPEPDLDEELVLEALERRGAPPEVCVWADASVDWGKFDVCVLRTPWDYHRNREAFWPGSSVSNPSRRC